MIVMKAIIDENGNLAFTDYKKQSVEEYEKEHNIGKYAKRQEVVKINQYMKTETKER